MGGAGGILRRLPVVLTMAGDIVGVLLAAGKGRRFGSDKLLHPLSGGTPMAVAAARKLRQACGHAIAVLRPEQQPLGKLLAAEGYEIRFSVEA
ncbi:MAG TPA: NTP transferase domain-containing protein, partial [Rhodocyclaceae bacterium]|nr:NTP transferase domain-containing protein [Rhodocyclaceae bacterium]